MSVKINRRRFLTGGAAAAASMGFGSRALGANDQVLVAVVGVHGRGTSLAHTFAKLKGAVVAYVCDVDKRQIPKSAAGRGALEWLR